MCCDELIMTVMRFSQDRTVVRAFYQDCVKHMSAVYTDFPAENWKREHLLVISQLWGKLSSQINGIFTA